MKVVDEGMEVSMTVTLVRRAHLTKTNFIQGNRNTQKRNRGGANKGNNKKP